MNEVKNEAEKEELQVSQLKEKLYGIIADEGYLTGFEKPNHIALYACLEIAAELDLEVFTDAIDEVYQVYASGKRKASIYE